MYQGLVRDRLSDKLNTTRKYATWCEAQHAAERLCRRLYGDGERYSVSVRDAALVCSVCGHAATSKFGCDFCVG